MNLNIGRLSTTFNSYHDSISTNLKSLYIYIFGRPRRLTENDGQDCMLAVTENPHLTKLSRNHTTATEERIFMNFS